VTNNLHVAPSSGRHKSLMCVVINNSSYPTVKNNKAYHAFVKHSMQARGFLIFRLQYCWPKVIYCICLGLSDGRYFTADLAEAGILKISVWSRYCENRQFAI